MLQENEETPAKDARRRPVCRARNKFPCASTEHESAQKTTRPEKRPEDRPRGRPLLLEAPGCGPCSKTRLPRFKCSTHFDVTRWRYFWLQQERKIRQQTVAGRLGSLHQKSKKGLKQCLTDMPKCVNYKQVFMEAKNLVVIVKAEGRSEAKVWSCLRPFSIRSINLSSSERDTALQVQLQRGRSSLRPLVSKRQTHLSTI